VERTFQSARPTNIAYRRDTWIPLRRIYFLQTLYQHDLALPANHPDVPPLP